MGDSRGDQREAHDSGSSVSLEALKDFGVTYRQIPIDDEGKWENEISESHQYQKGYGEDRTDESRRFRKRARIQECTTVFTSPLLGCMLIDQREIE